MPATPQPSNSTIYQQSLVDARDAWAKQSGLTTTQVKNAYAQAATSLGSRVASAPPTAPSTAWNLGQLQQVIQDYGATLDQRVLDAMRLGVSASFHDSADSVLKSKAADAYGSVFGPEAIDAHVRGINQRAAATYMTRTGLDGIKLSDRVWKANQQWRGAVQTVVQNAVISGQPPVQVARQIEQYLAPGANVPYKAETAKRLGVPKDTSMPAMRVARTEMQNSFHEGTISSHGSMPSYLGIRWHIAAGLGHVTDVCDTYAAQGFFPKGTEPLKPHPHCFCTAVPVHRDSEDVLNDLDEWLANPSSHPEMEAYYNDLKPIIDVEIASVAGAAGGPLLGGYAKGDKVLIDVKGTQVVATIKGEHASKGVLVLDIDPGQGIAAIKVWRAPSKVVAYGGPPPTPIPLTPGPPPSVVQTGIQAGTVVHATAGAHSGKVGEVTAINQSGGTYHVKWTDGTENNIVHQNVEVAPTPPTLVVGDMVKVHSAETPQVDGQIGTVSKVDADGQVTVSINVQGTQMAFDLPKVATFKLELVPPGAPAPPATPPQVIGYIDAPGKSYHGQPISEHVDPFTVKLMDGTYQYSGPPFTIVATDPLAAPPPTPPPPVPPPATTHQVGDHVQINDPSLMAHGQQGTIESMSATQVQIKLADGTNFFLTPHNADFALIPLAGQPVVTGPSILSHDIDHLHIGDTVKIDKPGTALDGQNATLAVEPSNYDATSFLVLKLADGSTAYLTKAEVYDPAAPAAPAPPTRVPANLDDLTAGDKVVVNAPGSPLHGQEFYIAETPAWYGPTEEMALYKTAHDAEVDNATDWIAKSNLTVVPGQMQHAEPPLHQLTAGAEVILKAGNSSHPKGTEAVLQDDLLGKSSSGTVHVSFSDGTMGTFYVDELAVKPKGPPPTNAWDHLKVGDKVTVNMPTSVHHGEEVTLADDLAGKHATDVVGVHLADGTLWSYEVDHLAAVPGTPQPASAPVAPLQGTHAQVDLPGDPMHGTQVILTQSKPGAGPTTPIEVMLASGPNIGGKEYFALQNLVTPGTPVAQTPATPPPPIQTPPPGVSAIDVTVKGTKVVTQYKGQTVTGTVMSFNTGKNVVAIKPDIAIPGMKGTTFTKSPKLVQPAAPPAPPAATPPPTPAPPVVTTQPAPPPTGINHLQMGQHVVINLPGMAVHGEDAMLMENLAGKSPSDEVMVVFTGGPQQGMTSNFFVSDLVAPGTAIASVPPPSHSPVPGDHVTITEANHPHYGETLLVDFTYSDGSVDVMYPGNTVPQFVASTDFTSGAVGATPPSPTTTQAPVQPPAPTPAPSAPVGSVTTKGQLVTTDYQGQQIQAIVQSFNASKNVVKLKPLVPSTTVPKTFEKSPKKLSLVNPPASAPPGVTVTPPPAPAQPTVAAPPHPATPASPTAIPPDPPKPVVSTFTAVNQAVGGGHVKSIYKAPDQSTWMFKPDQTAAIAEKSGYTVQGLLGLPIPEAHVMAVGGQVGSMQKFHDGIAGEVKFNSIASLTAAQRAEIQGHMVVDWLISQHDTNQGALLIGADGHVLAVDKGQAFKFLGQDKLDWNYEPNPDGTIYKRLFDGYIGGRYDLDSHAIDGLISKVEALDDDLFKQAVKPYVDYAVQRGFVPNEAAIYDKLIARKHTIRADFAKLYAEADHQAGKPPATAVVTPPPQPVAPPAKTVTANQVTPVAQPLVNQIQATGWAGHGVMVAGTDIENGQMLAYTVKERGDGYKLVVEGKVRSDAEPRLIDSLDGISHSGVGGTVSEPTFNQMLPAIKHIAFHLKPGTPGFNGVIEQPKLLPLVEVARQIDGGSITGDRAQHYSAVIQTITGWSPHDVATLSLDQVQAQILHYWTNSTAVHSAKFDPYVPVVAGLAPGKIPAKSEQPYGLAVKPEGHELVMDDDHKFIGQQYGYEGATAHTINLGAGMYASYEPYVGGNRYSKQGRLRIVANNFDGTPEALQRSLDTIEQLGLNDGLATHEDMELLYLYQQAHASKDDLNPTWVSQVKNKVTPSMTVQEKIDVHLAYWNTRMGVPDVRQLPQYDPVPHFDNITKRVGGTALDRNEGGWSHFKRFDLTRAEIDAAMPNWGLSHRTRSGAEGFIDKVLATNGQMLNTEERVRNGAYAANAGDSSAHDMGTGGASYMFVRLQSPAHFFRADYGGKPHFIFDNDLLLRTDNVSYQSDSYGEVTPHKKMSRGTTTAEWKQFEHNSTNETIIKNGFPLFEYVKQINAQSAAEKQRIIKKLKDHGITHLPQGKPNARPVEQVVVVMN